MLTAGTLVLLAAIVVGRYWIAAQVMTWQLESRGFAPASVEVTALDLDHILIENLQAGPGYRLDRARVDYSLSELAVTRVSARGLRVNAAYRAGRLDLGPLDPLLEGGSSGGPIPEIGLHGLTLKLATDRGAVDLALPGQIGIASDGVIRADTSFELTHPQLRADGHLQSALETDGSVTTQGQIDHLVLRQGSLPAPLAAEAVKLTLRAGGGRIDLRLDGDLPDLAVSFALQSGIVAPFDQPDIDASLFLEIRDAGRLHGLLPGLPVQGGSLSATAGFTGTAAQVDPSDPAMSIDSLSGEATLLLTANLSGLDGIAGQLTADADLSAVMDRGAATIRFQHLDLGADGIEPGLVPPALNDNGVLPLIGRSIQLALSPGAALSLPSPGTLLSGGKPQPAVFSGDGKVSSLAVLRFSLGDASLSGDGIAAARLALTSPRLTLDGQQVNDVSITGQGRFASDLRFEGRFAAGIDRIDAGGGTLKGLSLDLPLHVTGDADGTSVKADAGRINLASAVWPEAAGPGPDWTGADISGSARLGPCSMTACAPELHQLDAAIRTRDLNLVLSGNEIGIAGLAIDMSVKDARQGLSAPVDSDIRLSGITAGGFGSVETLTLKGRGRLDVFSLDHAADLTGVRVAGNIVTGAPVLTVRGRLSGQGGQPVFTGDVQEGGPERLVVGVRADPERVRLDLTDAPLNAVLELTRGMGVAMPVVENPEGRVSAALNLTTRDRNGSLDLKLTDASGTVDPVRLEKLNTALALRSLDPPLTDGPQNISIGRIDGALPLTDISAALDLSQADGGPALTVTGFQGRLMGGLAKLDAFTVTGRPGETPLTLRLEGIELDALATALDVEGISASGRISGVIPAIISDGEQVAIHGGKLAADAPGRLGLPVDIVRSSLAAQLGDKADLLLNALEDFRFTRLEIGLDKAFDGEAAMAVTLEGANPAHLDGHPFVFNINVTGNADRLIETILTVYRATSGVIESGVETVR